MLKKLSLILPILPKLGYRNVAYMFWYRVSMKLGWRKRKFPLGKAIEGRFFKETMPLNNYPDKWKSKTVDKANSIVEGNLTWFHYHQFQVGNPPNWFQNPFDGSVLTNSKKHWTALSDFGLNTGDVKIIWESSRFDWLTDLARAYRVTAERTYLETINQWLQDWSVHNPKNQGPNWKCGQETSIRVMKLLVTAQILQQQKEITKPLQQLVADHLERIYHNIGYAVAQNNNHGTSEGAGLYIGATWLLQQAETPINRSKLAKWKKKGRTVLENRILKLIAPQGTFAQRSVTYHRAVVDTMSWTLYAMEQFNEPSFSEKIRDRIENLGKWLVSFTNTETSDAPYIGPNDGAMFESMHAGGYRNFKYATQLLFGVLRKKRVYEAGLHDEPLYWRYPSTYMDFPLYEIPQPELETLDREFLAIHHKDFRLFMKLPNDRFRPTACDVFHLDVWYKGKNMLCDSGTYSYNAGEETDWFKSVRAHNTVQFGRHEQMPKISRFLYGKWIQPVQDAIYESNDSMIRWQGSYTDYRGNRHTRELLWDKEKQQLVITDTFTKQENETVRAYWHTPKDSENSFAISCTDAGEQSLTAEKTVTPFSVYYLQKIPKNTRSFETKGNKLTTLIQF